jgi:hypothetical protein
MSDPWEIAWRDYYELLGVAESASLADINGAFRARAHDVHPDRHIDAPQSVRDEAEQRFKLFSEAYEVLRHPEQRERYDSARVDASALRNVQITPATQSVWSATGRIVINSALTYDPRPGQVAEHAGVECDDPGFELQSIRLRAAGEGITKVTVRGRLAAGRSRDLTLQYQVGSAVLVQRVRTRAPLAPLLRLRRKLILVRWRSWLVLTFAGFFFASTAMAAFTGNADAIAGAAIVGAVGAPIAIPRLGLLAGRRLPRNRRLAQLLVIGGLLALTFVVSFLDNR